MATYAGKMLGMKPGGLCQAPASRVQTSSTPCLTYHTCWTGRPQVQAKAERHDDARSKAESDLLWHAGMVEARELLTEAIKLAEQQTRQQMEDYFNSEDSSTASTEVDDAKLLNFWIEQGCAERVAEHIIKDMAGLPNEYRDVSFLSTKLTRLRRLLPGDVTVLVAKDVDVLRADLNQAVQNMILLVESFPGIEVTDIIIRQPKLLYVSTTDLKQRIDECYGLMKICLPSWIKSKTRRKLLADNPELIFRLRHHIGKSSFGDLPVDIQAMVIAATGGNWWATT